MVVDKPAGIVTHPSRRPPRPGRSCTACWRTRSPAAGTRPGRASCTASTATPAACWSSPAPSGSTGGCSAMLRDRTHRPPLPGPGARRAARRRSPSTARSAATGATRTRMADRRRPSRRDGGHPPPPPGATRALLPAGGAARDRAHPPDPRPPGGGRPPGGRRPGLRPPRGDSWAWSASSCTPRGLAFPHPETGEPIEVESPLPADLERRWGARARLGPQPAAPAPLEIRTGPSTDPSPAHPAGGRCRGPSGSRFHRTAPASSTHQPNAQESPCPVTMKQLLESGVHFGHQTRRWNPKMKRYIFGERGGIYIIDLQQTHRAAATQAVDFVRDIAPARRHGAVRRHQEAVPGRRARAGRAAAACRTSRTAGSAAC